MLATLLSLADSRLPAGGHAHSAGAEQAVTEGVVTDEATLELLLRRRLATSGMVAAGLAAAAAEAVGCSVPERTWGSPTRARLAGELSLLDDEADARMPLSATRSASRAQGRGLLRIGRVAWPTPTWDLLPSRPHHPVALGVAAATGGASAHDAALTAAYLSLTAPATAVQRLLGLDPVAVAALLVSMAPDLHDVARAVVGAPLPDASDPLSDLLTAGHVPRKDKLFAS